MKKLTLEFIIWLIGMIRKTLININYFIINLIEWFRKLLIHWNDWKNIDSLEWLENDKNLIK